MKTIWLLIIPSLLEDKRVKARTKLFYVAFAQIFVTFYFTSCLAFGLLIIHWF